MKKLLLVCFSLLTSVVVLQAGNIKGKSSFAELQSFSAICNGEKIDISWKVAAGENNICFTIEKSKDGINFTKIIDVLGTGTCTGCRDYAERDYKPYKGTSYYRLKQTDSKGNSNYFGLVTINFAPQKKMAVYHAPLNANINSSEYNGEEVLVVLRDVQGKELVVKVLLMVEKNVVFLIDERKTVPAGNYIVTASSDDKIRDYKLVVR